MVLDNNTLRKYFEIFRYLLIGTCQRIFVPHFFWLFIPILLEFAFKSKHESSNLDKPWIFNPLVPDVH